MDTLAKAVNIWTGYGMPFMDLLQVILRIAHIGAAVVLAGGVVFQLIALQPALRSLDDPQRDRLRRLLAGRWYRVVMACIALLLISGLLNFLLYKLPDYRGQPSAPVYHGLFGIKLLAALALFHAALVPSLPGPRFDRYRARAGFWLAWATVLVALIVVMAAVMRYLPTLYA